MAPEQKKKKLIMLALVLQQTDLEYVNNSLSLVDRSLSQYVSNDPSHKGYIDGRKLLETPGTIYTKH